MKTSKKLIQDVLATLILLQLEALLSQEENYENA